MRKRCPTHGCSQWPLAIKGDQYRNRFCRLIAWFSRDAKRFDLDGWTSLATRIHRGWNATGYMRRQSGRDRLGCRHSEKAIPLFEESWFCRVLACEHPWWPKPLADGIGLGVSELPKNLSHSPCDQLDGLQ